MLTWRALSSDLLRALESPRCFIRGFAVLRVAETTGDPVWDRCHTFSQTLLLLDRFGIAVLCSNSKLHIFVCLTVYAYILHMYLLLNFALFCHVCFVHSHIKTISTIRCLLHVLF